jgi:hypothetical protein
VIRRGRRKRVTGDTDPDRERYPQRISGTLRLRTGDRIALTAHRTVETDETGCRMYELRPDTGDERLPITEADYLAGGISISVELVPAMSGMRFGFLPDP